MRFSPKSDAEIEAEQAKFRPLKGIFDFEVIDASDEVSKKSGNEMIKLKLCVYRPEGGESHVYDYLLEAMAFKFKHFCEAVGMLDRYEAGDINASDCINKCGKVELRLEKNDKGDDRSVVKDYIKRIAPAQGAQPPKGLIGEGKPLDDEIPF